MLVIEEPAVLDAETFKGRDVRGIIDSPATVDFPAIEVASVIIGSAV